MAQGGTYVRTNEQTDIRKIYPFYRTSSPIGAAALPPPMKTKEKVEQGKGTADHLMPLGCLFSFSVTLCPSLSLSVSLSVSLSLDKLTEKARVLSIEP